MPKVQSFFPHRLILFFLGDCRTVAVANLTLTSTRCSEVILGLGACSVHPSRY